MNETDRPQANPVVVLREEADDWAILFNPDTSDAIGINPVGVEIWKLLDGSTDMKTVSDTLTERFQDIPGTAGEEVLEFVGELMELGFVGMEVG